MAIIQTVNFNVFCDAFYDSGRGNQFSHDAKRVLFNHLEQMSDECGINVELDVISICCEYEELHYNDVISKYYYIDVSEIDEDDEQALIDAVEDFLNDNTMICGKTEDDCFVFAQF